MFGGYTVNPAEPFTVHVYSLYSFSFSMAGLLVPHIYDLCDNSVWIVV